MPQTARNPCSGRNFLSRWNYGSSSKNNASMHERYMNFFKPQKKPPTDNLHRKSEKMNETEWVSKTGLSGELKRYLTCFKQVHNPFIFCTGYQSRNWILVSRRKNNVYREGTIDWLTLPTIVHKVLKYKNLNYSSTSIPNSITPFLPPITRSFYPSFSRFSHRSYPSHPHRIYPSSRTIHRPTNISLNGPVFF